MKVGFLVWNKFQIAHFAELMRQFDEPDVIFIDRDVTALEPFNIDWLLPYGAYTRFLRETELQQLDGQYDVVLTQFNPPLQERWKKTRLVMTQYSLAKPRTAYNNRWLGADFGLVYGPYSAQLLSPIVSLAQVGNSRFDPLFENRLCPVTTRRLRAGLDPAKPNLLFLPTWGDLSSRFIFQEALNDLVHDFNVIYKPHHVSEQRDDPVATSDLGLIDPEMLADALDVGPHLMDLADVVVSDMSGAIFDGLYCRKPVILLGLGADYSGHKKAHPLAIEIARRHEIGPLVTEPGALPNTVLDVLSNAPYRDANEALVAELFLQRGGCARLGADALQDFVGGRTGTIPPLVDYAFAAERQATTRAAFRNAEKRAAARVIRSPVARRRLNRVRNKLYQAIRHRVPLRGLLQRFYRFNRSKQVRARNSSLKRASNFFELGLGVEEWAAKGAPATRGALKSWYAAQSELRFSRQLWRRVFSDLASWAENADDRDLSNAVRAQRSLGLLDRVDARLEPRLRPKFEQALAIMGPLRSYFEVAARNEALVQKEQTVFLPSGATLPFSLSTGRVFEMPIYMSLAEKSENIGESVRKPMIDVTLRFIQELHQRGWSVLPRIQAGYILGVPMSGKLPCATWHSVHSGFSQQVHMKAGSLPKHIIIDTEGYSGWASIANRKLPDIIKEVDKSAAEENFIRLQSEIVEKGLSKYHQNNVHIPQIGRYIFLPMQVLDDTVARLAYINSLELLDHLSAWGKGREVKLVVKRHPMCRSAEVAASLAKYEQEEKIVVSSASVHELIKGAEGVVTVNSGVGAEALLHLKPVITTGGADYAAATRIARNREELDAALEHVSVLPYEAIDIKRFLWHYTKRYHVSANSPDDVSAVVAQIVAEYE